MLTNIVLVDMLNLIHRNYNTLDVRAKLRTSKGRPSGLEYGTLRRLLGLRKTFPAERVACVWEGAPVTEGSTGFSVRSEISPTYKAGRALKDTAFYERVNALRQALSCEFMQVWPEAGYEADDAIYSLVQDHDYGTFRIFSTDTDMVQCLIHKNVQWWPKKDACIDRGSFTMLEGWTPEQATLGKAIQGDPTDAIAGVPGWGKVKTKEILVKNNLICLDEIGEYLKPFANTAVEKIPMSIQVLSKAYESGELAKAWQLVRMYHVMVHTQSNRDVSKFRAWLGQMQFGSLVGQV